MRNSHRLLLLVGLSLLVTVSVQADVDPGTTATIVSPDTQRPVHMRERIAGYEGPGPIDLPIVKPGPIYQPLGTDTVAVASSVSGAQAAVGALVPGSLLPAGGGDASTSPVVNTERRLRKLIRNLDD